MLDNDFRDEAEVHEEGTNVEMPAVDFDSFKGKEVEVRDYFDGLLEKGWKYDREESDLFYYLSKTFWSDGIKVLLVFDESFAVTPDDESGRIEEVAFYSFDKNEYKEKNIRTEYEDGNSQYFPTLEDYIARIEEEWPLYIEHSDFNSRGGDFDLLKRIEDIEQIPKIIQEEVWHDIRSIGA